MSDHAKMQIGEPNELEELRGRYADVRADRDVWRAAAEKAEADLAAARAELDAATKRADAALELLDEIRQGEWSEVHVRHAQRTVRDARRMLRQPAPAATDTAGQDGEPA